MKQIYDKPYVITGLVVFLIVITFPMWSSILSSKPSFENPNEPAAGETCIESKQHMRANHMQMLDAWRDEVVRKGERIYKATDGREWNKSLTLTCMNCHAKAEEVDGKMKSTSAATYCIDCHDYVGVTTYCWDCHVDPVAVGRGSKEAE